MKRKLLVLTIIMALISPLFLSVYKVQAYTGEIDPENYITCPSRITIQNNIGTGTVTLSASASGYNISYQKIDITKEKSDSIEAKLDELNAYIETSNKTIKEKESNLNTLKTEYQNLQNDETATEEQKTTARTNYETAYADYSEYVDNCNAQKKTLHAAYLSLVPDYTNSWETTTNSLNNIKLDFSNYTGQVYFILWVKIANGVNTYYKFGWYSSEIKEETKTDTEQSGNNNSTTTTEGEWTDFSNAKFELKKDDVSNAIVEISGITPKEDGSYYLYISSNNSKPSLEEAMSDEKISLVYDKNTKTLKSNEVGKVEYYIELNQDLYATIVEQKYSGTESVISFGNKLTRFAEPKYSDAFYATYMTENSDQIVMNFTHVATNDRKLQIKVGKITDTSILNKIKNNNSVGFEELLSYAKKNSGIYNETVIANSDSVFIEYNTNYNEEKNVINLKSLENDAYYFIYIKTDDENGKYTSNEAVTLAQASTYNNYWSMFFYGSEDFKWADWDSEDPTISPNPLPNTGALVVALCGTLLLVTSLCGVVAYKKYKKYNF